MKRTLSYFIIIILFQSCIALRKAPQIENFKVTRGKEFNSTLPEREMFVFEDPKDINHFYHYIDTRFQLNKENVYDDVPFEIDGSQYFFSWYETEMATKKLNLGGMFVDALFGAAGIGPVVQDYASRKGHWYIAMEVYSDSENDCLKTTSLSRQTVLKYLTALKQEYLTTHNYNETVFKD